MILQIRVCAAALSVHQRVCSLIYVFPTFATSQLEDKMSSNGGVLIRMEELKSEEEKCT